MTPALQTALASIDAANQRRHAEQARKDRRFASLRKEPAGLAGMFSREHWLNVRDTELFWARESGNAKAVARHIAKARDAHRIAMGRMPVIENLIAASYAYGVTDGPVYINPTM